MTLNGFVLEGTRPDSLFGTRRHTLTHVDASVTGSGAVMRKRHLNARGPIRANAGLVEKLWAERPGQDVISTEQHLPLKEIERHSQ